MNKSDLVQGSYFFDKGSNCIYVIKNLSERHVEFNRLDKPWSLDALWDYIDWFNTSNFITIDEACEIGYNDIIMSNKKLAFQCQLYEIIDG